VVITTTAIARVTPLTTQKPQACSNSPTLNELRVRRLDGQVDEATAVAEARNVRVRQELGMRGLVCVGSAPGTTPP